MSIIITALIIFALSAAAALALSRRPAAAVYVGAVGAAAGSAAGIAGVVCAMTGHAARETRLEWNAAWGGSLSLGIDALSAFFVSMVLLVSAVAAVYGIPYTLSYAGRKNLGASWFFYNVLVASMMGVCIARNAFLFLFAWEVMALSSFFLVMFESQRDDVRSAGWIYLVASHVGTAFLLVMFVLLAGGAASFDFAALGTEGHTATVVFILALIGFGTKAGFVPLHVWLPEAHPAAPSHVSAVMSGVMIKTGIYGLLRVIMLMGTPQPWWGWTLVAIGATSGVLGVLFALSQHDLKRLLAYHSVENIGIIALGLGVGVIGWCEDSATVAVLGFGGGLLHVWNHALFKGLLFLGAGAVKHATHTLEIDELGGLAKAMPYSAAFFLVGSAAICGLPPLNGFVSEFLVYLGSFSSLTMPAAPVCAAAVAAIGALALIGGLAAACFAKCFGIVFLGEPRSTHGVGAHEAPALMIWPMAVLAAACGLIGLAGPFLISAAGPVVAAVTAMPENELSFALAGARTALSYVTFAAAAFAVALGGFALMRRAMFSGKTIGTGPTWDCGYAKPTPRMQYTASSFAQPIVKMFRTLLRPRHRFEKPTGLFPETSRLSTETPDVFTRRAFMPAFRTVAAALARLRVLQEGRIQIYVLYVALTLLVLLVWKLR